MSRLRAFALVPVLFLGLAACSEPAAPTTSTTTAPSSAGSAASSAGAKASGAITLYTSEPQNKIDELIAEFNKQNPDVKVNVFRAATGDLKTRIETERTSGKVGADVVIAADVPTFEGFKKNNLLAKYTPADASALMKTAVDADGYYVGTRIIPTVIMYNKDKVTEAPKSWADIADPKYNGKITMPNPDVSGAAAYNAAVWLQDAKTGEAWLKKLAANKPLIAESNGPVSQAVASGTQPVGIVVDYLVRDLAAKGSPVAAVYPTEGAPYISQPGGIFADAKNPAGAKAFMDFVVSKKGQEVAVKQNYLPVRDDAGAPAGAPKLSEITFMEVDPVAIAARQKDAVAKFKEIFAA